MSNQDAPEAAPLLAPGRHLLSLTRLQEICLDNFPSTINSVKTTRDEIFSAIELLVGDLMLWGVRCQIWIDGQFMTTERDPDFADMAIIIDEDVFNFLDISLKNDILTNIDQRNYHPRLSVVVIVSKPRGDPDYECVNTYIEDLAAFWQLAQSRWLKGLAVMMLGENDVGIRFLS